jgi:DNA-binding response OmpR family regulator
VRSVTVRALESGGYRVLVAASGREALRLDLEAAGPIRLLVTDVVIPGLDGPSLAAELCRRHPGLRVLYVSGYAEEALGYRGVLDAGIELLPKPFTAASLLARVRAVLDGR